MGTECKECGGIGLVKTGNGTSAPCNCQIPFQIATRIRRAQIPPGFEGATFASFRPSQETRAGFLYAQRYAEEFPPANNRVTDGPPSGVLMAGSIGTGKTHLAASLARRVAERGFQPLFVDVRELLARLRRSYDRDATETESQIMGPTWAADLVVIDELGATRPSDWAFETIELLIGGLYNRMIPTIVTTNLTNQPPGGGEPTGYQRAARQDTLGDRIGARMFSRLQQMCKPIEMTGPDFRRKKQ